MNFGKSVYWFLIFLIVSTASYCQQVISGRLIDQETGSPIPFASIGIIGTSKGTTSNLNGQFSLALQGPASIKITCVGYESMTMNSSDLTEFIQLKPSATQLNEVFVLGKSVNPRTLVRKAFSSISRNYTSEGFLQKFFYRHYCKDDSVYGRLIEASVDVWKHQGYRSSRKSSGDREEIRVTQLRRSLDKTAMAQGHEAISVGSILQADIAGYQTPEKTEHLRFYDAASNVRTDFENYQFTLEGITTYDGLEVYKILYVSKKDSILTTSGYVPAPEAQGTLFISMDTFAFIKTEDVRQEGPNVIRTSAYYRKSGNHYFPYHFIREGESRFPDKHEHSFHLELMSVDIQSEGAMKFSSREPGKEDLLKVPYDSVFWGTNTILKTTPLEDKIIHDLGGGRSLDEQFYRYHQYEWSTSDGGKNGTEKFNWLKEDSRGERVLFIYFITSNCQPYLPELEQIKKLSKYYRNNLAFVLISIENDEARWKQTLTRYSLFADGIINYRIDESSEIIKHYNVKETPVFVLLAKDGSQIDTGATNPRDPLLEESLKLLRSSTLRQ